MGGELTLYTHPQSRGRIARWMLEEVGRPYRVEPIGYGNAMQSADFLRINPMGKVPALVHGDAVVTETAAICAYLADAFPEAGLRPRAGSAASAAYHRWLFFAAGPVEQATSNGALGVKVPADREKMVGYGSFARTVDVLEAAVDGRSYIAGDEFSAADVYVGAQIGWGMRFGWLPVRQAFATYWQRLSSRPAAIRASRLDDMDQEAR